jgi:hypothetical protein
MLIKKNIDKQSAMTGTGLLFGKFYLEKTAKAMSERWTVQIPENNTDMSMDDFILYQYEKVVNTDDRKTPLYEVIR